ncbi:MAG TPA: hypothetical protein VNY70_09465 [Steroidobacteraceae bacterium]|jgi:hypothetical protein|nr:hypothetical protein [Steroidobacteraceae bacterium]
MTVNKPIAPTILALLGLLLLVPGCVVVEPREGFYDRDHHRWYHEHGWRDCGDRDEHCRRE